MVINLTDVHLLVTAITMIGTVDSQTGDAQTSISISLNTLKAGSDCSMLLQAGQELHLVFHLLIHCAQ